MEHEELRPRSNWIWLHRERLLSVGAAMLWGESMNVLNCYSPRASAEITRVLLLIVFATANVLPALAV